jgi:two-component system chemotaxis response regulator CheB
MAKRNIIVIGASAGGFEALKILISSFPPDLDASIFIVWHMSPDVRGVLPDVLNKLKSLPAAHGVDGEPVKSGRIYVAPPDHHLLINKEEVRITRGPKENRFRPAVDPLFRSAANSYRERVIGIILSGALDDGTAGLWSIKQHGGLAIVQDPRNAEVPSMPENAIRNLKVDYILPISQMGQIVVQESQMNVSHTFQINPEEDKKIKLEVSVAMQLKDKKYDILDHGNLSHFTCPECHGVLTSLTEGGRMRFRCHTGHAFSADSLLASITETIEGSLWNTIRNIQESVLLLNDMGDHFANMNEPKLAAMFFKKGKEAEGRSVILRQAVMNHEQLSIDSIVHETQNSNIEK